MRIKPLISLFFVWLLWGGYVVYSVNSQSHDEQVKRLDEKLASQGQVLQWFFQERTLALKNAKDDEPLVARYSVEDWKNLHPWKAVAFIKDRTSSLYGPFEKIMPEAHRNQIVERIKKSVPAGRIDGVHWEAFQWNGTPLVAAYVTRPSGTQVFLAPASDWGKSLSLLATESDWSLVNQAGIFIFHSDLRYVGEQKPKIQNSLNREIKLPTTNLNATLTAPRLPANLSKLIQIALVSLGFFIISWVVTSQYLRSQKELQLEELVALKLALKSEYQKAIEEKNRELSLVVPKLDRQNLFFKDLSHRVAASLGRQLQPSFVSILGHSLWLESLMKDRSDEEKVAMSSITREARASKDILDKVLTVAGEVDLEKQPMKLETPLLRALKRWEPQFNAHEIRVEKNIQETSFYPINNEAIEKALGHIFENAVEAMTRQIEKTLTISLFDDLDNIYLRIQDTGSGIAEIDLQKISDPFFTTKAHLSKLGLGLTETFGLLKQHHAIISVSSELGKGTQIEIRFDKNEAKRILELSHRQLQLASHEGRIIIPKDLPLPLEAAPPVEENLMQAESQVVEDQEIEKLLDITILDFIESVEDNEDEQKKAAEKMDSSEPIVGSTDLLDENPLRGPHA
ncbi:MAG: sensor histidine kinase [Bdellovibrionales bacterium]